MNLGLTLNKTNIMKFVAEHILIGLVKATGRNPFMVKEKAVNHQCVKLTKDHEAVGPMIVYWCSLNINRLQRIGANDKLVKNLSQRYARFMSAFNHAIIEQKEKDPSFDAWLFFDGDVENTGFFELIQCERNNKEPTSSIIIRATR